MNWGNECPRILILGAGCTGLGAAYRLHEIGYKNFQVLEQNSCPGGLAASFVDENRFTWDLGGHVLFSHYDYFDALMNQALGQEWLQHMRQSYIYIQGGFVPYPFQKNLHRLPLDCLVRCLKGLIRTHVESHSQPTNFRDWILHSFGTGISELFLLPYNLKVWAHPLEMMSARWVGERVAPVDLESIIENVVMGRDDPGWGPNNTFRFPSSGGTGAIWKAVANLIPKHHINYNTKVRRVDTDRRTVLTEKGMGWPYDILISTLPLDILVGIAGLETLESDASQLKYTTTHVVGIGLSGKPPAELASKNWIYFPGDESPFYRVTVFSNYSPQNVPDASRFWSLLAEVSQSPSKDLDEHCLVHDVIKAMLSMRMIGSEHEVASTWHNRIDRGYPIPTLDRDDYLARLLSALEGKDIYSRGRFGSWKYEVGNQDHSCMQGVEVINRVLFGVPELTLDYPRLVNQEKRRIQIPN
jgi:protoporphyrinogen oxidase